MALKKIGLLGGSFDPVHRAHIVLANTALSQLGLDQVQLLPAADPWQRKPLNASASHRLAMVELAIQGHHGLAANPAEIMRGGKTYTIDTLQDMPRTAQYFWILGADQLENFCTWHRWEDIVTYVHLVVARRPGSAVTTPSPLAWLLDTLKKPLIEIPFEPIDISATQIRSLLKTGQPADTMLDPKVLQYIQQHHLYHH